MNTKKVWFITGASKGLGLSLAEKLLEKGYKVAATSRKSQGLIDAVGNFNEQKFLPLEVNLTSEKSISEAVEKAVAHFGKIDVLVNNAGYGIGGAVEELNQREIKDSFDINVLAVIKTMQSIMPYFKEQKSGNIINISSIAGFAPGIGWAMYAATKYAVMGISEVMAEDVKEFGVKVTVVAPGAFRTEFLQDSSLVFAKEKIEGYNAIRASHEKYTTMNGTQIGNPEKLAQVLIDLAENPNPPVRLYVGSDAYTRAKEKIRLLSKELESNKEISFSTDF
ncbi:NADP-dependent 3-hydroxy acid dehydrogenase YdfG [Chryseobacterium taichungense]|uniref:NADP-dependent 3-hydroxy acid dehydrogenase YdfG n=1 Tax=Chryseobacterium taichungense TaxID=295069 RepID=A0A1H7X559_9FLAO|nr:SDR family NAD(P)-dependent oxidoreductase [Chryseobacterium taichungense]SEM28249.1 NADP-dependent 3-hydroxy acid dehydrogenase YdfG [Chryseobacterium taichungense]